MTTAQHGAMAGTAGATALNAVTYLDMAVRGRPASDAPAQVVEQLLDRADVGLPGNRHQQHNRLDALGALSGLATGAGAGAAAGWLRGHGFRMGRLGETAFIGGLAMALTDGAMAVLGVSDPRSWTAVDWAADALPHLVFGATAAAVLDATEKPNAGAQPAARTSLRTLARAALAGVATGGRTTAGVTALALSSQRSDGQAGRPLRGALARVSSLLAVSELVVDKRPSTPSRLDSAGLAPRAAMGLASGAAIGRRRGENVGLPAVVGLAAAGGASVAGLLWRETGASKLGLSAMAAALIEDALVITAAAAAVTKT